MSQTEKTLSWILKGGLLLTPFIVFIVTRSLYFPFITGKNFAFRVLVELLAVIWIYAALKFPSFRPRSSALAWAVVIFIAIMGLATVFSLSPYHSFWSSFERMEGYVALLHLLIYFLLLSSVFKSQRDWSIFLHTSLASSVMVSIYAVLQLAGKITIHQGGTRVDATLGNATYLAAYLLFHIFFLTWFFLRSKNLYARLGYAVIFLLEIVILYHTATRGAMLGLLAGFMVLALLLLILERGFLRRFAAAALGLAILAPIVFILVKDTAFVKHSDVLIRFASISPQETTTQSRFTIWNMAFQGWKERPILGWGQESFVYVFSKYYEPSLWRQEPWFDRAHNVFLDWLTAGGILGLASYLGMFAAAGWVSIRSLKAGIMDKISFSAVAGLLSAHFFQNLFVFDNLTSYLLFFAVLAYVNSLSSPRHMSPADAKSNPPREPMAIPSGIPPAVAILSVAVFSAVFYFADLKPISAARSVLDALNIMNTHEPAGRVDAAVNLFREGIKLNTFGTTELREQISQTAGSIVRDQALAVQDKSKFLEFAVSELEEQNRAFPRDMRAKAFLATVYTSAGRPADAIRIVNEALETSDRRQQFYFVAAEAYLNAGQNDKALEVLKRAHELAPDYPEAITNLATVLIISGREEEAEALLENSFGKRFVADERYAQAYAQRNNFRKALIVWKELVKESPDDAKYHASLGVTYAQVGDAQSAEKELEEAVRLEPRFKTQAEEIIRQIRGAGAPR